MTDIFDNPPADGGDNAHKAAAEDLKSFATRIARLEDEKAVLSEDIKEVFGEAKARGYDVKALRLAISLSKKDKDLLAVARLYADNLGVFG
jgi:uncharacterized protein (UPF0335 family)